MAGLYTGTELGNKVFYGFRYNPDTGNLNIEVIDGDAVVSLPQDTMKSKYDYKQWVWSSDTLEFYWNTNGFGNAGWDGLGGAGNKGRLLMRII
jgi:hypothetical protein